VKRRQAIFLIKKKRLTNDKSNRQSQRGKIENREVTELVPITIMIAWKQKKRNVETFNVVYDNKVT
jgi:hypothetical protein